MTSTSPSANDHGDEASPGVVDVATAEVVADLIVAEACPAPPARVEPTLDLTGPPPRVVVYDQTGDLGPAVHDALAGIRDALEVVVCTRPRHLGDVLTEGPVEVLVAGAGLETEVGLERLRIIREEVPAAVLVLVVPSLAGLDARALVRTGAVDLVELEGAGAEAELANALRRALSIGHHLRAPAGAAAPAGPEPSVAGRVLTVASASGGSGKTFLATNLAWFLHRYGGRRVCVIDLDLQFGEVSSALRLRPRYTIADLLQHATDDDLVTHFEEFCEVHESGIAVLAAPVDPTDAQVVRPADVGRVIDAARAHFDDVIVDTPPALADTVVASFHRSDELLVMATPDVPSVRNMHVFLSTLERLDVSRDGLRLLLNKAERETGVDVSRILKLFPQGFDATLPYAREVHRALSVGRVVLEASPEAEISRQLGDALRRLLPPDGVDAWQEARAAARAGRLRRFGRRERSGS